MNNEIFIRINSDQALIFVIVRAFLLFIAVIFLIRFGNRRFQLNTSFDYILLVILGSLVSRGINGNASLISTLMASVTLVFCHRLIALGSFNFKKIERLFKGKPHVVIKNGLFVKENLKKLHLTENDIIMQMRLQMHIEDLSQIKLAYLESSGNLSFIKNKLHD